MAVVREAVPTEVSALAMAMTKAFAGEPVSEWMLPQRTRRRSRRRLMFRLELETYIFPQGGLVTTADSEDGGLVGACFTLPPDQWEMPKAFNGRTAARYF